MWEPSALYDFYVAALRASVQLAVVLSLLVSADRVLNVLKFACIKLRAKLTGRLPQDAWFRAPLPKAPEEYPLVAVQLPMFNERAVCQAIIDCCAELEWPAQRLKIQVLDDSTDGVTRELVDEKVLEWRERGIAVECVRRTNRQGYKAGAMKEGMEALAREGFEFVAVFDADFKPEPGFLHRTLPYLMGNPQVGYVQSRWVFTNPQESYLTKAQEVSLNYHMKCEQYTHSAARSFFNFNGVWRLACIEHAGGWNARTTVEDMDLSLRAYLRGWSAVFLHDVACLNELPLGRKVELILLYFGVRKCSTHLVSLGFFCTLVPLTVFTPEVHIPTWALVHLPVAVTLSTSWFTRKGWLYSVFYVLFENAMGTVKLWAVVTGLLDLQRAQEWVVTTKLGSSDKRPGTGGDGSAITIPSCRLYLNELAWALFTAAAGFYGLFAGTAHMGLALYLLVQSFVFLAFGLNWVDAGGLLGGRLDEDVVRVPVKASGAPLAPAGREVKRAYTIPVIKLDSEDRLPAMRTAASAYAKLDSGGSRTDVLEGLADGSASPSTSSSASSLHDGYGSSSPEGLGDNAVSLASVRLADRWNVSPDSSLTDIYATKPAAKLSTPGAGATPAALAADMLAGKTQPRRGWGSLFGLAPAYERLEAAHVD
ncbi:hypothetical protein CHLNCDRAFT_139598 [Chlorella variabilis]|uniref:glucomannan 4-beta-mannosyltransferase n=1 Tax=Chlorella variabilis TaxID=554065 RepID=E1ZQH9_CHLVA|nr:hypothetical protein CHLNCDRAFT_139598 [Chlorella variabilis]EFN51937.1 hypothetical protein CHLNCDRAFT_139598 [Chlorella variabilis]|eukprot:XP_005844039.1 hypothetical protein CHLNCDRAFT_139598 [Chlorella variabilis]